ncbi:MAG: hypothetical protein H6981_13730 [Gammaproteobacteria bacterium]|nr:hypothetical protein [Gammaproteobacteria bacterium]
MCIATPRGRSDERPQITARGLLWAGFITIAAALVWLLQVRPFQRTR